MPRPVEEIAADLEALEPGDFDGAGTGGDGPERLGPADRALAAGVVLGQGAGEIDPAIGLVQVAPMEQPDAIDRPRQGSFRGPGPRCFLLRPRGPMGGRGSCRAASSLSDYGRLGRSLAFPRRTKQPWSHSDVGWQSRDDGVKILGAL
jgi:hypothetical protein